MAYVWEILGLTEQAWKERIAQQVREDEKNNLYEIFHQMRTYAQKTKEKYLEIQIRPDGSGCINLANEPGCNEWIAWENLEQGAAIIPAAVEKWLKEYEEENA